MSEKMDTSINSIAGNNDSDHLLLVSAYKKWYKTLNEVVQLHIHYMNSFNFLHHCYIYIIVQVFFLCHYKVNVFNTTVVFKNGTKAAQQFCRSYFLSSSVMYMIRLVFFPVFIFHLFLLSSILPYIFVIFCVLQNLR